MQWYFDPHPSPPSKRNILYWAMKHLRGIFSFTNPKQWWIFWPIKFIFAPARKLRQILFLPCFSQWKLTKNGFKEFSIGKCNSLTWYGLIMPPLISHQVNLLPWMDLSSCSIELIEVPWSCNLEVLLLLVQLHQCRLFNHSSLNLTE